MVDLAAPTMHLQLMFTFTFLESTREKAHRVTIFSAPPSQIPTYIHVTSKGGLYYLEAWFENEGRPLNRSLFRLIDACKHAPRKLLFTVHELTPRTNRGLVFSGKLARAMQKDANRTIAKTSETARVVRNFLLTFCYAHKNYLR